MAITSIDFIAATPDEPRRHSAGVRFVQAVFANRGAAIGFVLVAVIVLVALFAPWIAPYGPAQIGAGRALVPPNGEFWFGTDQFGRDVFSRVVYGAHLTMMVGLVAVGISLTVGMTIGLIAGYARGWLESILMRSMDVVFSFTETLIALAAVAVLGPSLNNAIIAVGIAFIPIYARVAYSVTLVERSRPYFDAAYAVGAGHLRLIFRHLLPNVIPPMIVVATLGVSTAILSAAGLSYLGLGAQPPLPVWGAMLSDGQDYITLAPWLTIFPGLAIMIVVLGFNLLGEGFRDAMDPRQRKR